jgi:hypothetical protein
MFFYLFLCRKDKYFRFQIRSNGCKIVKICKIPPQNMRGAKPLNFPTAPLQLLYHLTSCRPLNSSSRSRAVPLEHLFGQLHTYLLHRKSSRLPKHKTHCPKSRFCFLGVQVYPFSAIPRRFSAPPLKRDRYLILSQDPRTYRRAIIFYLRQLRRYARTMAALSVPGAGGAPL